MIEVQHLTKSFGSKRAVDDISFTLEKGEILGFLGPNGAGKSTTMRMITGFIPPTGGTAVIGGHDILEAPVEARKKFGYLPENAPVYPDMSVSDYLDFCAEIRGFNGAERKKRVGETIGRCFLGDVRHQTIGTLSKGFRQRVCFAQSILHDPEYLIMDEPTDGLDPNQKHEVRLMIREMSADKAVLLSTHILDEVDAICTRAIIIANGRIQADDTPAGLRTRSPYHGAVSLTFGPTDSRKLLSTLRSVEGVKNTILIEESESGVSLRVLPETRETLIADRLMAALSRDRYDIRSMFVEQGRLDEVFRTITM